jgi:hypothetical protein
MRRHRLLLVLFAAAWLTEAGAQLQPVGRWREHLEFQPASRVTMGENEVFVASKFGIYSVSLADNIIERYSKVSGLNDIGISTLRYNTVSGKLLIAYNNSNLDVLYRNDIINIPYIERSNVSGDKRINDIYFEGNRAYLSTNLGVIVVNMDRYEISNTWFLGQNGASVKVNGFTSDANFFYAATDEGLKAAPKNNNNLEDFRNWTLLSNANGLPNGPVRNALFVQNRLFVQYFSTLFVRNGTTWSEAYTDGFNWFSTEASDNSILISEERNSWQQRRVVVLNATNNSVSQVFENNPFTQFPVHAVKMGNELFVADLGKGLLRVNGSSVSPVTVNSPYGALDGELLVTNNTLYVAGGSINEAWNYQFNGTGFFTFTNDTWTDYNRFKLPWMDSVYDIISIAVDPRDQKIYAGSYGGGLVEFETATKYKIYKQGTAIGETIGDPNNYRIGGLAFDLENNLWFTNFGAATMVGVKKSDGSWSKFNPPFLIPFNMVGGILIDDFNQKWIQVPQGNGLLCFNHGASIENTGDDRWRWFQTGSTNGNLPGNFVNTMAKDKDGFIWLGTDKGIGIIQCPGEVFTANGCSVFQPIVQQDNFAGLLFENEDVKAIAVDGANRKWVGTRNGVWLLSPDGDKVIQRFTAENSPLLSNEIIRIAIDPTTGEVFFSTFNGICSYRGTATEGSNKNETVLVFPNPVPSGYGGTIAIRGVASNSIVKITELNGRLVFQTRALGGQAVWNGLDYTGRRVSSGVYLVLVADELGQEKTAGKIVFIK